MGRQSMAVTTTNTTARWLVVAALCTSNASTAFQSMHVPQHALSKSLASFQKRNLNRQSTTSVLFASDWDDGSQDANRWRSSDDGDASQGTASGSDWQEDLARKKDGTFWSSFQPSEEEDVDGEKPDLKKGSLSEEEESEAWLNTLASLSAEEVEYNLREAERADKVRQMEEWGFDRTVIANALDVAVDTTLEEKDEVEGMQTYREESYLEEVDLETVESHTKVEMDEETGEPIRSQMVYVDEHTCIGCTNCAMIAQSTFFMHSEHGRARVFQQWGDDDETIQVAIETCPVDCIHYVPYEELVRLEEERRGQNINFKARLVSQGESGISLSHRVGGANAFTAPQQISGNMGSRCNNCPSRGCKNCPMYGVGKNPEYERKEKARKERIAKRKLQEQRQRDSKSVEL